MRKAVQARRQKLREIAERDFASRCQYCHVALDSIRLQMGEKFCSTECEDDDAAFQARWAAAKARVNR